MSEVSLVAGGYRYGGALTDAPALRGKPGRRRSVLTGRVLEIIGDLGGEASTVEIRAAIEARGIALDGRRQGRERVPDVLHRLARTSPPEVMPVGDPRGGQGRAQRWRLTQGGGR
jgi:hypothetical protein